MDYVARFIAYASAFESAYVSDDWANVGECLAEDAVYRVPFPSPLGGVFHGRAEIVDYLRRILNGLDRRFESRSPELLSLSQSGDLGERIQIRGRVTYTHPSVPPLVFELDEVAVFAGDEMVSLEDIYDAENKKRILDYIGAHSDTLGLLTPTVPD